MTRWPQGGQPKICFTGRAHGSRSCSKVKLRVWRDLDVRTRQPQPTRRGISSCAPGTRRLSVSVAPFQIRAGRASVWAGPGPAGRMGPARGAAAAQG